MNDETYHFDCVCRDPSHVVRFTLDDSDDLPGIVGEVYLERTDSFWRRLQIAFLYAIGRRSEWGEFGSWMMTARDTRKLREMLDRWEPLLTGEAALIQAQMLEADAAEWRKRAEPTKRTEGR